jgi:hypothetical protein
MGKERYPRATRLLITADGGGSNGSHVRLWKIEVQKLADERANLIVLMHVHGFRRRAYLIRLIGASTAHFFSGRHSCLS